MRIAIVKLSALGDIVHAMVVLQFIKEAIPECRIDWIVEESFAPILEHNPHIDTICTVNLKALKREKLKFFSEIRKIKTYAENKYDLVIDVQGLIKSAIVSSLLGKSVGFDSRSTRESSASWFYNKGLHIPYEMNVIERNFLLSMQALGLQHDLQSLKKKKPFLFFMDKHRKKTISFLEKNKKNIVYILGSSWESKIYPKEKFVEIIKALEGNHLLVWGSENENKSAVFIAEQCEAVILPKLNLNELKAVIASADLVIGGDSGPTHMAWAMNRPSITLFGPTPSKRNTLETAVNKVLDCGQDINPRQLVKQNNCIREIDSSKIVTIASELLYA